jgi:hypothetical protein
MNQLLCFYLTYSKTYNNLERHIAHTSIPFASKGLNVLCMGNKTILKYNVKSGISPKPHCYTILCKIIVSRLSLTMIHTG